MTSLESWVQEPIDQRSLIRKDDSVPSGSGNGGRERGPTCDVEELTLEAFCEDVIQNCSDLCRNQHDAFTPLFVDRRLWFDPFKNDQKNPEVAIKLREQSNRFNFDLSPKIIYSESSIVSVLVTSGVARYLDFRGNRRA